MGKKSTRRIPPIAKWPDWVFLALFFIYTLSVGLLVQLVLLPYVFPAWHAGDGLMMGMDSRTFHWLAVHQAYDIDQYGWQAWSLVPSGQAVAGIASIFYVLIKPHPWALLPWNSLLHVLATWALYKTLRFFLENRIHAILAALPLLLFPSALSWVTQIHNDNYAVAGGVLVLYAWVCLARKESWQNARMILGGMLALVAGAGLTWLVRDYIMAVYTGIGTLLSVFIIFIFLIRRLQSKWTWTKTLTACVVVCFAFALLASWQLFKLGSTGVKFDTYQLNNVSSETQEAVVVLPADQGSADQEVTPTVDNQPEGQEVTSAESEVPKRLYWQKTSWLPSWVDYQMKQLSITRAKAIREWTDPKQKSKGSNIDTEVVFHSAMDIVRYLPRATKIGLFSPFPTDWLGIGSKAPNTMMRRVSGIEMSFIYLCWPGLLYAVWTWRKRPELWTGLLFCLGMITIYVLGLPNIGTLYRLRYAYIMPLVGFGIAGWINYFQIFAAWVKKKKKSYPTPDATTSS
jgi:hypothetical protein